MAVRGRDWGSVVELGLPASSRAANPSILPGNPPFWGVPLPSRGQEAAGRTHPPPLLCGML